jgi:hypothetical protein
VFRLYSARTPWVLQWFFRQRDGRSAEPALGKDKSGSAAFQMKWHFPTHLLLTAMLRPRQALFRVLLSNFCRLPGEFLD